MKLVKILFYQTTVISRNIHTKLISVKMFFKKFCRYSRNSSRTFKTVFKTLNTFVPSLLNAFSSCNLKQVKTNLKTNFYQSPCFSVDVSWQFENFYKEDHDFTLFQYTCPHLFSNLNAFCSCHAFQLTVNFKA